MPKAAKVETASGAPELIMEREFAYPIEDVFKAWTDQDALRQWMGPAGFRAPEAVFGDQVGAAYAIPMISPDGATHTLRGVLKELIPNKRLRFTSAWDQEDGAPGQQMEIALDFEATETGTRLVLRQTNFIDENARDMHAQGWGSSLDCLEAYLGA